VSSFRSSALARADILSIAVYTIDRWSEAQADKYLGELEAFCQDLADGHRVGRACDEISPGLFRAEYVSHVVFYRPKPYGVRVVRVLHQRQLPKLHSFEDDDSDEIEDG
jgi:toxin ParE1/3/4